MLHVAGYQMHTGRWRRETIDRPFACSQKHRKDSAQAYVRHQMEGPSSTGPADIAEPAELDAPFNCGIHCDVNFWFVRSRRIAN